MTWHFKFVLGLGLIFGLIGGGCVRQEYYPQIALNQLQPTIQAANSQQEASLKVALASITSPKESLIYYEELLQYLEEHLRQPVKVVQRKTYKEVNDLIAAGEVDLAFICTYSYVLGAEDFGLREFLVPNIDGKTTYQSYIIVPADSPATEFKDLQQKSFAFTDPDSTTGHLYPHWLLQQMGEVPETFFRGTLFTHSHDNSIKAVADGVVDGAAIDGLVLDYIVEKQPEFLSKVRIIARSQPFGMPPVVVSPKLTDKERMEIQNILAAMHLDARGQTILAKIRIDSFLPQNDAAYDSIRRLAREVFGD